MRQEPPSQVSTCEQTAVPGHYNIRDGIDHRHAAWRPRTHVANYIYWLSRTRD